MKKLNPLLLLGGFILLSTNAIHAQCDVPAYVFSLSDISLTLVNQSDFIVHPKPNETNSEYYEPICQTNNAELLVSFEEGWAPCKQSFYTMLYKRPYDCNGNYTGPLQWVLNTPIVEYDADYGTTTYTIPLDYVEQSVEYTVEVYYRGKNIGCIGWGQWHFMGESDNLRFINSSSYPNAAATLNQIGSDQLPSFYGPVTVSNLQYGQNVIFNATPSTCEDRYSYQVSEFNLATWTFVPGTIQLSNVIMGQAPSINLSSFYTPGFQMGKIYAVSINLGYFWDSETYFFRVVQANVQADIPDHNTRLHTVGPTTYTIEQVCSNYLNTNLNVSNTVFETSYSLHLTEVNTTTLAPIGSPVTIPTTPGNAGTNINLTTLWGPGLHTIGKVYRVMFTAGMPNQTVTIYFEYKLCGVPKSMSAGVEGTEDIGDVESATMVVFPNPTSDRINLKLPGEIMDQPIHVQLIDMTGKVVMNEMRTAQENVEFSLIGIVKGIYTLVVIAGSETFTERIIKE